MGVYGLGPQFAPHTKFRVRIKPSTGHDRPPFLELLEGELDVLNLALCRLVRYGIDHAVVVETDLVLAAQRVEPLVRLLQRALADGVYAGNLAVGTQWD